MPCSMVHHLRLTILIHHTARVRRVILPITEPPLKRLRAHLHPLHGIQLTRLPIRSLHERTVGLRCYLNICHLRRHPQRERHQRLTRVLQRLIKRSGHSLRCRHIHTPLHIPSLNLTRQTLVKLVIRLSVYPLGKRISPLIVSCYSGAILITSLSKALYPLNNVLHLMQQRPKHLPFRVTQQAFTQYDAILSIAAYHLCVRPGT